MQVPVWGLKVLFPAHLVQVPLILKYEGAQSQTLVKMLNDSLGWQGILQIPRSGSQKVLRGHCWQTPPIK